MVAVGKLNLACVVVASASPDTINCDVLTIYLHQNREEKQKDTRIITVDVPLYLIITIGTRDGIQCMDLELLLLMLSVDQKKKESALESISRIQIHSFTRIATKSHQNR